MSNKKVEIVDDNHIYINSIIYTKQEIYDLYITRDLTYVELGQQLNLGKENVKKLLHDLQISRKNAYGVPYSQTSQCAEKRKKTNLDRYGVVNYAQTQECKDKKILNSLNKYGVEHHMQTQSSKDQLKKTCQEKYGVDSYSKTEEFKNKLKDNCLSKFGVDFYVQTEDFKQKSQNTFIAKYGVSNPMLANEIKDKIKETNLKKYGVENYNQKNIYHLNIWDNKDEMTSLLASYKVKPTIQELCIFFNCDDSGLCRKLHDWELDHLIQWKPSRSHYEDEIIELLTQRFPNIEIELNNKNILDGKEIDIYLPQYKIGIEFNGDYWHSDKNPKFQDHHGRSTRHQDKSLEAESKGVFIFHIFEHEWDSAFINANSKLINSRENIINRLVVLLHKNEHFISARKCLVREISREEKNQFLDCNHIQGKDYNSNYYLGLFYNEQLVGCMTFGSSKYKKYNWELTRFASLHNTTIRGGASKLFNYFVQHKIQEGENVVSYSDITKTKGDIYKILGFRCVSINQPNYLWINLITKDIRTRYQEQSAGENQRMHNLGYVKVCDCGTKTWLYEKIYAENNNKEREKNNV